MVWTHDGDNSGATKNNHNQVLVRTIFINKPRKYFGGNNKFVVLLGTKYVDNDVMF